MKQLSLLKKLTICLIAGLVTCFCVIRISKRFLIDWLNVPVIAVIGLIILLASIIYGLYWGFQKRRDPKRNLIILAFWEGLLRYAIALDLTMIGLQKFFRLQFSTPLAKLDLPFSSLSPEEHVWAFFGQSYGLTCVIGSMQIIGSLLLLFNRTKLLGVVILLPVILNIILLNTFYHMEWGESFQALELFLGLLYLLLSEYPRLVDFFLKTKSGAPSVPFRSPVFKNLLRLSVLVIPFLLIWHYGSPNKDPWLRGKYQVAHLTVNNKDSQLRSCADSVLTVVYFDQGNECVFDFNGQHRLWLGKYRLDAGRSQMKVAWRYPPGRTDTLFAKISAGDERGIYHFSGTIGSDQIKMDLKQVPASQ